MPAQRRARRLLEGLIGWRDAAPGIRAQLLETFCSGIRLRSLVTNVVTLLIVGGFIVMQTPTVSHVLWLAAVALGGFLPRLYAVRLCRDGHFDRAPESRALVFVGISAVYGAIWGLGALLLMPHLTGASVGILLMVLVFGTVMGPYAAMPGILYVRLATTGSLTLLAVVLYAPPSEALISAVLAGWLVLRTDAWRGYHRSLRRQLELREALESRRAELEKANRDKEHANIRLRELAETDPLTGTANRRQLMAYLHGLCGPGALILFDVDRFKSVNDRFGHPAGDAALVDLARLVQQILREDDMLARLGGDEFAIVLSGMDADDVWQVAERIRAAVQAHVISVDNVRVRITASLGVATLPHGTSVVDPSALLSEADALLYDAKRQGRNRIMTAERGSADLTG